jgi:hypothetical protein
MVSSLMETRVLVQYNSGGHLNTGTLVSGDASLYGVPVQYCTGTACTCTRNHRYSTQLPNPGFDGNYYSAVRFDVASHPSTDKPGRAEVKDPCKRGDRKCTLYRQESSSVARVQLFGLPAAHWHLADGYTGYGFDASCLMLES